MLMAKMRAIVWEGPNDIKMKKVEKPTAGYGEAIVKTTTISVCTSDIHFVTGEYPIPKGLTLGHEFVGVVDSVGPGVTTLKVGERVAGGSVWVCGTCYYCKAGCEMCQGGITYGPGNTVNGCNADFIKVNYAENNLAKIPDHLSDTQVLFVGDIMSTGIAGSDRAEVLLGVTVAIFCQGPVGLCATIGAKLHGAGKIISVEPIRHRQALSKKFGADVVLDPKKTDVIAEIIKMSEGRGADVAIEAIGGKPVAFDAALRSIRAGGKLSSLGIYTEPPVLALDAIGAGIFDKIIIMTLVPTGTQRMNKMIALVEGGKVDLTPLITHTFDFSQYMEAYRIFSQKLDNVVKVAIKMD
jgi:2-desacetyl-2-hydroxyethyl bacteriochlorophyllide A dehydrogenase